MYDPAELYSDPILGNFSVGPPKKMPYEIRQKGTQHCVHKKGSSNPIKGGCHPTRAAAIKHLRALYANVPDAKMTSEYVLVSMERQFAEGDLVWLEALPAKTWHTVDYGEVPITVEKLQHMIDNFKNNVRGQEVATNFDHGTDRAKGNKASGWFRDFKIAPSSNDPNVMSLHAGVEFTEEAKAELADKQWKYFSLEWEDYWDHPETQDTYVDVIVGGGLTNRPIAKGMVPINFSEVWDEVQMANKKGGSGKTPYGNVTYADPGYQSDNVKRYPLDSETHVRAAWSYINMPKNAAKYSSSQLSAIKGRIRAAMKRIGATLKGMSEAELMDVPEETLEVRADDAMPELGHSEPGTDVAPALEEVGDVSGGADTGSRRDTPPAGEDGSVPDRSSTIHTTGEGGETMTDLDAELRELLGLNEDDDVLERVAAMKETVEPLEKVAVEMGEKKAFAETYPEQAAELKKLREAEDVREAKSFAEKLGSMRLKDAEGKETNQGFAGVVLQKAEEVHKKFSEGRGTLKDVEELLESIAGNGIVEFGERGSANEDTLILSEENPRMAFAEAVKRRMNTDESLSYEDAIRKVAEENPQLALAYQRHNPAA